jgi:hypothetical protein
VDRVEEDSLEREEVEEGWGWGGVFPLPELQAEELPIQVGIFTNIILLYAQSTHRVATAAFLRTFHDDGKIRPGW